MCVCVCVCCNRMIYCKIVLEFQVSRYNKASSNFMVSEYVSVHDKQWICKTCYNALKRELLPAMTKAKNLDIDEARTVHRSLLVILCYKAWGYVLSKVLVFVFKTIIKLHQLLF